MSTTKHAPGVVRDAIVHYLKNVAGDATISEIIDGVEAKIGFVPPSSVRSYLRLRSDTFVQTGRGRYRYESEDFTAMDAAATNVGTTNATPFFVHEKAQLFKSNCFNWLDDRESQSVHAIVTDPPYGLVEYSSKELTKLKNGKGGVWRIPPSFDGHKRSPLPRFTTLTPKDLDNMHSFFCEFAERVYRVLVPGAHIFLASNPLVSHIVANAISKSGLETRGTITRLVMTMRGGDRPKNAHEEFIDVTVMPRSMAEPWLLFRKPLQGRVQDNLRTWGTGGLRRPSADRPFGDVIKSHPTQPRERKIAPHPSLKPQAFLRNIVRASLPLGTGVVLDPFAGSGSTLAAANHVGYSSIGVELSDEYASIAMSAIPALGSLICRDKSS